MLEVEQELAKVGVPIKTRHNEVAPGQYEIAPIYENSNVGSDHQQLTMQILQTVARRYGMVCLLHEKPFAGVNGSGKHNNWAMATDTGENLVNPTDDPVNNPSFLFFCSAVIRAVNKHQALLRASVANIGQDHRLGANEAPPAIISIFLGAQLENAFEEIVTGEGVELASGELTMGTDVLPSLPLDSGDRNRTSPFAFTGNKFEFRALGSSMSLGFTNAVLNTIVAEAIDELAAGLKGEDVAAEVKEIVKGVWAENKQIVFGGDGYSEEWHAEAERRGLVNLRTTPDALPSVVSEQTVKLFGDYNVLSERELHARFEVFCEQYATKLNIEGEMSATIARTKILPAALRHMDVLAKAGDGAAVGKLKAELEGLLDQLVEGILALEEANQDSGLEGIELAVHMRDTVIPAMAAVRDARGLPRAHRGRRPLAPAEVRGDALHQVGRGTARPTLPRSCQGWRYPVLRACATTSRPPVSASSSSTAAWARRSRCSTSPSRTTTGSRGARTRSWCSTAPTSSRACTPPWSRRARRSWRPTRSRPRA